MLGIIIFHLVAHTMQTQLTDTTYISEMNNGWFSHPTFYKKLMLLEVMEPLGTAGNATFILIAGYFLIDKGNQINIKKSAIKLIAQLAFASLILIVGGALFCHFCKANYTSLHGTGLFNGMAWFIGYYFLVILFANFFLNNFLAKLSKEKYVLFLVVLFAIISFGWSGALLEKLANGLGNGGLRTFATGVFLYSLAGFMKIYNPFKPVKTWVLIFIPILTFAIILIGYHNTMITAIQDYARSDGSKVFVQKLNSFGIFSIEPILLSVCTFELFTRIKMPHIKVINFLGAATFMAYLLHNNAFVYSLNNIIDWMTLLAHNPWYYCFGAMVAVTLATFAVCVVVYALYLACTKLLKKHYKIFLKQDAEAGAQ